MNNNFLGVSKHSLENGNRIIIPSGFRDFLSPEFVLFKSMDGCLSIYEKSNFDELLSQLNQITNTKEGRMRARNFTRAARKFTLDKQGRFTIPADFLAHASLKDTVYLTGEGNRLEIWNEEEYLAQEAGLDSDMYPDICY
ncbi:MAG: cell division/cell wall cluster transcriptional repressor MraZ [Clostridia bacterium]|nr:cell division/cell wall cluster transcriptional repressor MraZ [Clostridia bacterium]